MFGVKEDPLVQSDQKHMKNRQHQEVDYNEYKLKKRKDKNFLRREKSPYIQNLVRKKNGKV